ncbi:MAG TPA: hypothetical protein VMU50_06385, partial [Polyangia bacterium]|nr:hypothetical protein [Polyangia bacterium]
AAPPAAERGEPRTGDGSGWRARMLVVAAALIAFGGSLRNQFTYDEGLVIGEADPFLRSGSLSTLVSPRYFAASREGTYRPVVTLSYMVDRAFGEAPFVFKADSLLLHAACALLVLALARRLLPATERRFALIGALFFAVHPLATETVDNASFREDGLVTFFVLSGLLLALADRLWPAALCYALGLLSKESAVVFPILLLGARLVAARAAVDGAPARRSRLARELVVLGAITIAYLAVRFGPMNTPGSYARFPGGNRAATLLGMPAVLVRYARLVVWPWPLLADYSGYFDFGPRAALARLPALLAAAALLAAPVVAWRRGATTVAFGLAWFFVALLPVANVIAIPVPAAERFLYLPLAGVALALSAGAARVLARWPAASRPLLAGGVAVAIAFVALANRRHLDWHDNDRLWAVTAAQNPRSCGAQSAIGGARVRDGLEGRSRALLADGVAREELALRLCPPDPADPVRSAVILTRLGAARAMLGHLGPAREALQQALALEPRYALGVVWLGYVQFMGGDKRGAEASLRHAVIDLGPPDGAVAQVASQYMDKL